MVDMSWLSSEAKSIHLIFHNLFYALATVLILIGVVTEFFKMPIGGSPVFAQLIGRAFVAAILLEAYPEISNALADLTDSLASKISHFNQFDLVLSRMGDKLNELTWSWTSLKETVIMAISFITFFLLYISVFLANAGVMYVWTLLYVFSPLLIALFILPVTSTATKALFRSIFEVSAWKIVWAVLATLLWSMALTTLNKPQSEINFLTVISLNLILAVSLLLTPLVVNALIGKGLANMAASMSGVAAGASMFSLGGIAASSAANGVRKGITASKDGVNKLSERYFGDTQKNRSGVKKYQKKSNANQKPNRKDK